MYLVRQEQLPFQGMFVKAGEIHSFVNIGDVPLIQLDIHLNPRFVQENLD
jgi:mannose-6-phosphate isomerase-like protein (cupin superfamily)